MECRQSSVSPCFCLSSGWKVTIRSHRFWQDIRWHSLVSHLDLGFCSGKGYLQLSRTVKVLRWIDVLSQPFCPVRLSCPLRVVHSNVGSRNTDCDQDISNGWYSAFHSQWYRIWEIASEENEADGVLKHCVVKGLPDWGNVKNKCDFENQ